MKPKPLASLNHFTVPCSICFLFFLVLMLRCGIGRLQAGIARTTGGMAANAPFKHTHLHYTPISPEAQLKRRACLYFGPCRQIESSRYTVESLSKPWYR